MRCPFCGSDDSQVLDTRDNPEGIHRRRKCRHCGQRYNTIERVEIGRMPLVIKRDGRREPFDREKLIRNIRKACDKRPLPVGEVERLVDDIEQDLVQQGRSEVPSRSIGELAMDRLKRLDQIAYIRFASVYLNFADINDLAREVDRIRGDLPPPPPPNADGH